MWVTICFIYLWILTTTGLTTMDNPWKLLGKPDNVTVTISHILKTYDVRLRPNFGGDPLYIGIETTLDSFQQVSEVNMDYTITIILNQYWKDERLAFSSDDDLLTLSGDFAERIWVPDTFFANDKQSFLHDVTEKNKMVRLQGDGSIILSLRFTTKLSCQMDLQFYPLDSQNCTVEIESYGYTVRDLVMYWKGESVMGVDKVKPPQFKITAVDTNDRTEELATGVYQRLSLSFAMKREMSYFIFQLYLPSILIVMLSWIAFWINHEAAAARVALGITTVLTMTTLSSSVRASLPRISYVKAIDIYLVMCFVFVFAALLEYATVNNTFWENKFRVPTPPKKTPKIEISKPQSSKGGGGGAGKKSFALAEAVGLRFRSQKMAKSQPPPPPPLPIPPPPSLLLPREHHPQDKDNLCTIQVMDTSFPTVERLIQRSTSFSGISGVTHPHSQNLYVSPIPGASGIASGLPGVPDLSKIPRRKTTGIHWRKRKFVQSIRKQTKSLQQSVLSIRDDVNIIDKYSRLAFPLSFALFNIIYWSFYYY